MTDTEKETKKEKEIFLKKKQRKTQPKEEKRPERQPEQQEKPPPAQKPEAALLLWNLPQANTFQSFSPRRVRGENTMTQPPWAAFTSDVASLVVGEVEGEPAPLRRSLTAWSQRG